MADVREHNGEYYVLSNRGYTRATPEQAAVMSGSNRAVAIKSALATLYGFGNIVKAGLPVPDSFGEPNRQALSSAGENMGEAALIQQMRPQQAATGEGLIDALLTGVTGGGALLARKGGQKLSSKVAYKIMDAADDLPPGTSYADDLFGGTTFGSDSVGAAATGQPVGGLGKVFRTVTDLLDTPKGLSADQYDVLASGLAQKTGFEFPPGVFNSNELFATFMSNPATRQVIQPTLDANAYKFGAKFITALGLDPADYPRGFGRSVIRDVKTKIFRPGFKRIASEVGDQDFTDLAEAASPFLRPTQRASMIARQGDDVTMQLSGEQVMRLRSQLNKRLAAAWKAGDAETADTIEDLIMQVDARIGSALGPDSLKDWRTLQEQYRTYLAVKRAGSIDPNTDDLSIKSLVRNLGKQYEEFDELGPDDIARMTFQSEKTRELLEFGRVARLFQDAIGDSGTATRSFGMALAGGKKSVGNLALLRYALEYGAISPEDALRLAQ